MKILLSFITLVLLSGNLYAQILSNVTMDLNVGGEVYDVAYDDAEDVYIIVGDFTYVQGQPRLNLAFIDATTLAVTAANPITSIDGHITSVEYVKVPGAFPGWFTYYLYLGGDYHTINGQSKTFMSRLRALDGFVVQSYALDNSWTAPFVTCGIAWCGINDFELIGDTIVAAGNFDYTYISPSDRYGIVGFNAASQSMDFLTGLFSDIFSAPNLPGSFLHLRYFDGYFYLNGTHRFDASGDFVSELQDCQGMGYSLRFHYDFDIHESSHDTIMMGMKHFDMDYA